MARESLEQRQARVERDAEHNARNEAAIAAERRALDGLRERTGRDPAQPKTLRIGGEPPNPLTGVDFASDAAAELAAGAGMRAEDFRPHTPSSNKGFTAADVRKLIAPAD